MKYFFLKSSLLRKLIFIFKNVERKFIKSSFILFVSIILSGIFELLVLISLSDFLSTILKDDNGSNIIKRTTESNISTGFYSQLILLTNQITNSELISSCLLFIFVAIITFIVKIYTLDH